MDHYLRIQLLGGMQARMGDAAMPPLRRRHALRLWVYLLLHRDSPLDRAHVAFALWPESSERRARLNLRQNLHQLGLHLPDHEPDCPWLLRDGGTLRWNPDARYRLDVAEFEQLFEDSAQAAKDLAPQAAVTALDSAAAVYRGDLLPDQYDDWLTGPRDHLSACYVDVLERLSRAHEAAGSLDEGLSAAQRLLEHDPLREATHRRMMRLLFATGDRAAALRQFDQCRETMRVELDVEPLPDTLLLRQAIKEGRPIAGVDSRRQRDAAPTVSLAPPPEETKGSLPRRLTNFVGRHEEMVDVSRLISERPLVVLTGPAGCGKTRLALEVAGRVGGSFPDGTWWSDLVGTTDPRLVPRVAATALGVHLAGGGSPVDALCEHLRGRRLLLVMDNCEHLAPACAQLAERLIGSCPGLCVLATSRVDLEVPGEAVWRVPSLRTVRPGDESTQHELVESEAVRLFLDRALERRPELAVDAAIESAAAEIAWRLDGLPLAIELAAARVSHMSPEDIALRLDDVLRLLATTSSVGDARHRSLQAAIDWSYELLDANERSLLRRLSTFSGGFALASAEAVCAGPSVEGQELAQEEILDVVAQLVAASLVVMELRPSGESRYRLLETVRQYGLARLADADEAEAYLRRHAAHFLELAETARDELTRQDQARWLRRLETERDNLRAALRWAVDHGESEWALRMSVALQDFWIARAYASEGQQWLEDALESHAGRPESAAQAGALIALGQLVYAIGDEVNSSEHYTAGLEMSQRLDYDKGIADATFFLGHNAGGRHDLAEAGRLLEASLGMYVALGDEVGLAETHSWLGHLAWVLQELPDARTHGEASLEIHRARGNLRGVARQLDRLAYLAESEKDMATSGKLTEESLGISRRLGDKPGVAGSLRERGVMLIDLGDYRAASPLLEESLSLRREIGLRRPLADTLLRVGEVRMLFNEPSAAIPYLEESMALYALLSDQVGVLEVTHRMGRLHLYHGDMRAARDQRDQVLQSRSAATMRLVRSYAFGFCGLLACADGDFASAEGHLREGQRLSEERDYDWGTAFARVDLGLTRCLQGDYEAARTELLWALPVFREFGDRLYLSRTLTRLATVSRGQGAYGEARSRLDESLTIVRDLEYAPDIAMAVEGYAELAFAEGHAAHAATLYGGSDAVRTIGPAPRWPVFGAAIGARLADLRDTLGERSFDRAWAAGRRRTMDQIVAFALRGPG